MFVCASLLPHLPLISCAPVCSPVSEQLTCSSPAVSTISLFIHQASSLHHPASTLFQIKALLHFPQLCVCLSLGPEKEVSLNVTIPRFSQVLYEIIWFAWVTVAIFSVSIDIPLKPVHTDTACTSICYCIDAHHSKPQFICGLLTGIQFNVRCFDPSSPSLYTSPAIKLLLKGILKSFPSGPDNRRFIIKKWWMYFPIKFIQERSHSPIKCSNQTVVYSLNIQRLIALVP